MKTFETTVKVSQYYYLKIEAKDEDEAIEKANNEGVNPLDANKETLEVIKIKEVSDGNI